MPKRRICLLLCLLSLRMAAQTPDDEYYPYAEPERHLPLVQTDSTLFYRAVQARGDLYGESTAFNLPQVARKRRAQPYARERIVLDGLETGYRYAAALRLLGADETPVAGLASTAGAAGLTGGIRCFDFSAGMPLRPYRVSVHFSDRNYLVGARLAAAWQPGRNWDLASAAEFRTGRDLHVEGVFTQALTASLRATKHWANGRQLALTLILPPSMRGLRLSSVEEAFTLTGDRLYNPAWGYQAGKVRNSRVRREFLPLAIAAWRMPLSASTTFAAAFGSESGLRKYSALGWYDARTPMPDNYRYLPSFAGDRATGEAWRADDSRYTQIDWDELIAQNRMRAGSAAYALEDRVERVVRLRLGAVFTSAVDARLTLHYGVHAALESVRNYKQVRDLLGARYIADIDQYLVDDDTYGNLLQNDLRHPGRLVTEGGRFGYDYTLTTRRAGGRLRAEYRADRLRADLDLTLETASVHRNGHYEKELFPGSRSCGPSRRMTFSPYTLKGVVGYAFSPRNYLEVSLLAAAVLPDAADLFYQPLYNNRTVDAPSAEHLYAAEASYRLTGPRLELQLTAYATAALDGIETRRYYDDLAGCYCDLATVGIGTMACGVEVAAALRLAYRWRWSLTAAAGRFEYIRNPRLTLLADTDNTVVDNRAESHMGGCFVGGAPQYAASTELAYFGPKGWGARASAGYAGDRYVTPAPVRRTARVARQSGVTEAAFRAFTRQERLDDAFTVDASLFKTFRWGRSQLTATLIVRNLAGFDETVYDGYESSRIRTIRAGAQTLRQPQATRYTYALPRSFYLSVTCRF